ncbi:MAG: hypothetical protein KAS32_01580 [Candidatus Peribacteraceae bacterium]|nr:hypothetical protein [Candidatus Peribacteraceae bacterium]
MITSTKNPLHIEIALPDDHEGQVKTILEALKVSHRITRITSDDRGKLFALAQSEDQIGIIQYLIHMRGMSVVE